MARKQKKTKITLRDIMKLRKRLGKKVRTRKPSVKIVSEMRR